METKVCGKCGVEKLTNEYYKDKNAKDGYYSLCKKCKNEYTQANKDKKAKYDSQYHKENKEKRNNLTKQYYLANKEKVAEYHKNYYSENKDVVNNRNRMYYQKNRVDIYKRTLKYRRTNRKIVNEWGKKFREHNKDRVSEYTKKYRLANKEKVAERYRKYKRSERGRAKDYISRLKRRSYKHKVTFTSHERLKLLERDKWTCQSCGIKVHDRSIGDWNTPDKAHIDHIVPISKGGNSEPINLRVLCRTCNLSKNNKQDEQLKLNF